MSALTLAMEALVIASLADVVSTRAGLRTGRAYERNPLMRWATKTLASAVAAKTAGLAFVFWQLHLLAGPHPTIAAAVAWVGAAFTARLAYNNFRLTAALTGSSCVAPESVRDSRRTDSPSNTLMRVMTSSGWRVAVGESLTSTMTREQKDTLLLCVLGGGVIGFWTVLLLLAAALFY